MKARIAVLAAVVAALALAAQVLAGGAGEPAPLAGPSYTPQELQALIAYADASPAGKRAILDGRPAPVPSERFDWGAAGIGAGVALVAAFALAAAAVGLGRGRPRRAARGT